MFWEYPNGFKAISNKPGHKAEFIWGDNVLMLRVTVEAGSKAEGVIHTYEQISMVLEGSIEVQVANEKKVLKKGDAFYVPAGVPHGGTILETPTVILESCPAPPKSELQEWKEYGVRVGKPGP